MNNITDASNVHKNISKPLFSKEFAKEVKNIDIKEMKKIEFESFLKTEEDVIKYKEILKKASDVFFGLDSHFEFQVHEKTGTVMSKLVNTETGETIREIPSEKILDMIAGLWEIAGVIIDDRA